MSHRPARRWGASLLEIQVALVVLGIALAGACPVIAMQMKLLRRFEARAAGPGDPPMLRGQRLVDGVPALAPGDDPDPPVAVIHPSPDRWARRLGAIATVDDEAGSLATTPNPVPAELIAQEAEAALVGPWTPASAPDSGGGAWVQLGPGAAEGSATWTFPAISSATYRVLVAWPGSVPVPPDATIDVATDGDGVVSVALTSASAGPTGPWLDLGNVRLGPGASLRINRSRLGVVVADAVRVGLRNQATILQPPAPSLGLDGSLSARFRVATRP